ncbi:MAG TPA: CoA transferase [Devosiaceae bacterium]|jgi:crotonobetainyl-CoA:carnitine CoA-transferase CaiB-like acyl-CoA transferase
MSTAAQTAFLTLLGRAGIDPNDLAGAVRFLGEDPVVPSYHRYGAATASALAAYAAGMALLWRQRTGQGQDVTVDLARAVNIGLRSAFYCRQNGQSFRVGSSTREENVFRTADERLVYLLRNTGRGTITQDLVGLLRSPNNTAGMAEAVSRWQSADLEEALAANKLPGTIIRAPEEWLAHPQGQWLANRPGFHVEKIGESEPEPLGNATRPLDGLRVLDVSHVIAGPSTGRLLAEQGGDVLHAVNPLEQEKTHVHIDTAFGKRSAYVNLNMVEDVAQLRELAAQTDIFIQNWRPGVMIRRGFSPEEVAALRPGIIYVSISCYGSDGPWAERGGYEPVGQNVCGLSWQEGSPGKPRNAPTVTMNDYLAPFLAGAGIMGALLRRCREGGSYHVTTSLTQASMWVLAQGRLDTDTDLSAIGPYRPREGEISTRVCAFGEVTHANPIVDYSVSKPHWVLPPQPAGASRLEWLTQ